MLGSLMSSGEQIYLDRDHPQWKQALGLLVDELQKTVKDKQAAQILLRGFPEGDDEDLKDTLLDLGFSEQRLPDVCLVKDLSWQDHQEYVKRLGRKYRNNFRKEILAHTDEFDVVTEPNMSAAEIQHCYELYCNVHARAAELNVYRLPFTFFDQICQHPDYDIIRLYCKEDPAARTAEKPIGVMYSFVKNGLYSALMVGLDYDYLTSHSPYKQMLYHTVQRAWELNCQTLDLAYTAVLEKKKVGARPYPSYAYVQLMDHYNQAVLASFAGVSA
ncbi:MAG: GNAT family N-acetyltransferase [Cyanobacteria bacterium P01_C01_bin.118]